MSSPDHAADAGMSYQDHVDGIVAGIDDARRDYDIEGRLIVTCVRHFGIDRAMKVARQVVANPILTSSASGCVAMRPRGRRPCSKTRSNMLLPLGCHARFMQVNGRVRI